MKMNKKRNFFLIAGLLMSTQISHGALVNSPDLAPQHIAVLESDLNAFLDYSPGHWANRDFNEAADGYRLADRISDFKNQLASHPPQNDSEFFSSFSLFIRKLHDGHLGLTGIDPRLMIELVSGLNFAFSKEGVVLTDCNTSNTSCKNISTPAIVAMIDGIPSMDWINARAENEIGTMIYGRKTEALKSLTSTKFRVRGSYEQAKNFSIQDASGHDVVIPINWSNPFQKSTAATVNPDCVSSFTLGDVFVLRVKTFECTVTFAETTTVMDARFNQQLTEALSKAIGFRSVLIDLRDNGGGSDTETKSLALQFISASTYWYRISHLKDDLWTPPYDSALEPQSTTLANNPMLKTAPLWILTNGGCFSACSMFVRELRNSGRAKVIGTPMDGGVGGPRPWKAPSGLWGIAIPSIKLWDEDGTPMEDSTIIPDVQFLPQFSDFQKEKDPVLSGSVKQINALSTLVPADH